MQLVDQTCNDKYSTQTLSLSIFPPFPSGNPIFRGWGAARVLEGATPQKKKGISLKNGAQPYSAQKQPPYLLVVRADLTKGVHSMMRLSRCQGVLVAWWLIPIACQSTILCGVGAYHSIEILAEVSDHEGMPTAIDVSSYDLREESAPTGIHADIMSIGVPHTYYNGTADIITSNEVNYLKAYDMST